MLRIDLTEAAGRAAYLAAFHAAQAFISEKTGRSVKTHKGVHSELQRLTKDDLDFSASMRAFLPRNYNLKSIADYEIGPDATVSLERATMAVGQAKRFVAYFEAALANDEPGDHAP